MSASSAETPTGGGRTTKLAMPLAPPALAFAAGIALGPWIAPRAAWALLAAGLAAAALVLVLGHAAHTVGPLLVAAAMLGVLRGQPAPLAPDHVGGEGPHDYLPEKKKKDEKWRLAQ